MIRSRAGNAILMKGFTIDEFAALLSKYDYNFKPGDIVNGTSSPLKPRAQ